MFKNNILGRVPNAECHSKINYTLPNLTVFSQPAFISIISDKSFFIFDIFSLFLAMESMIARQINSKSLKKLDFWMVKKFSKPTEDFRGASSQVLQRLLRETSSPVDVRRALSRRGRNSSQSSLQVRRTGHQQVQVPKSYHRLGTRLDQVEQNSSSRERNSWFYTRITGRLYTEE